MCLSGEIIHVLSSLSLCAESSGLFGRSTREEEKPQPSTETKKPQVNGSTMHTHTHTHTHKLSNIALSKETSVCYIVGTHTHIISKLMGLLCGHTHIIYLSLQPEVARKPKRSLGSTSSTDATSPVSPAPLEN